MIVFVFNREDENVRGVTKKTEWLHGRTTHVDNDEEHADKDDDDEMMMMMMMMMVMMKLMMMLMGIKDIQKVKKTKSFQD